MAALMFESAKIDERDASRSRNRDAAGVYRIEVPTLTAAGLRQGTFARHFTQPISTRSPAAKRSTATPSVARWSSPKAHHVAEAGGGFWLLDEIALIQSYDARIAAEGVQGLTLTVRPDRTAALVCEDGNNNIVFSKEIPFTDFPLETITLWFVQGDALDNCCREQHQREVRAPSRQLEVKPVFGPENVTLQHRCV